MTSCLHILSSLCYLTGMNDSMFRTLDREYSMLGPEEGFICQNKEEALDALSDSNWNDLKIPSLFFCVRIAHLISTGAF